MGSDGTVGVVLSVYDGQDYVAEAIDSVLAQTYEPLELVVVDDGSTDDTAGVVREYDDPRVTLVTNDRNRGIGFSRNRGARRVNGDLVAFIDHDDVWHPEKLRRHVERHRASAADVVYSDVRLVDAAGNASRSATRPDPRPPGEPLVRQFLLGDRVVILTPSSVTIRRAAWEAVGGCDPEYRTFEDVELYVRLAADHEFERIADPLVDKRDHDTNVSDDYRGLYGAHERTLGKALDRFSFLGPDDARHKRARMAYRRATSALLSGDSDEAVAFGSESLRHERRLRPALVAGLGTLDRLAGPFDPGHRLLVWYDRRFGG
jgi:glycosyltransferase involved in cell wall biosynthesis